MDVHLLGKFCAKKLSLKILKKAKTASNFCLPCSERLIFNISIYGLPLVNWHSQIYPGQNAKEITLESLKITVK